MTYGYMTYPVASTVALFLTNNLKFAKFQRVKTKASSKRLFHNVIPTLLHNSKRRIRVSA